MRRLQLCAEEEQSSVMLETSSTNSSVLVTMKNPGLDKQPREDKKPSDS